MTWSPGSPLEADHTGLGGSARPQDLSEAIREFAEPLLAAIPRTDSLLTLRRTMDLVATCWNLPALEHSDPARHTELRRAFLSCLDAAPEPLVELLLDRIRDRVIRFGWIPFATTIEVTGESPSDCQISARAQRRPGPWSEDTSQAVTVIPEGQRILCVDDDPAICRMLSRRLEKIGYSVATATSGSEALAILASPHGGGIDGLITDLNMRGMDGIELSRAAQEVRPGIRAILLTGAAESLPSSVLQSAGIERVLAKPVGAEELTSALAETLALRERSPVPCSVRWSSLWAPRPLQQ